MFRFILGLGIYLAVCPQGSLAFEPLLVQEGDYFTSLTVPPSGLMMTGGRIDNLTIDLPFDSNLLPETRIEGGSVGNIQLHKGSLTLTGGEFDGQISVDGEPWVVNFLAPYVRIDIDANARSNPWVVQGWLNDGSFFNLQFFHSNVFPEPNFNLAVGAIAVGGDADLDCDVDLDDLNVVRNNFGSEGPGDLNQNGTVNLQDVRIVRSAFDIAPFTLPPHLSFGTCKSAVPEPAGWALASVLALAVLSARRFLS